MKSNFAQKRFREAKLRGYSRLLIGIVILVILALAVVGLLSLFNGGGHGFGFLPGTSEGITQKESDTDKQIQAEKKMQEASVKEIAPKSIPEKKLTFDENLEALAKSGFSSRDLPNIMIFQFDKGRKNYVSVSMDEVENSIVTGMNTTEFWEKLEETLEKFQSGQSSHTSSSPAGIKTCCRGILLVNPPTTGTRDYTTTIIKKYFPDTPLRVYDGDN